MLAAAGAHNLLMIGPPGSGEPRDILKSCSDDSITLESSFPRGAIASVFDTASTQSHFFEPAVGPTDASLRINQVASESRFQ
ncbi:ATP-binding protein [Crateriforma spongiae]|uniref:ATP-binding protein n=1 Tax=Crateriforma spongiae TaxID=2724528 RepID=UPI0014462A8F|nr:ATP-binding protein [Crateriforma spongiae]